MQRTFVRLYNCLRGNRLPKFLSALIISIVAPQIMFAQRCKLTDLSENFNYDVSVTKAKDSDGDSRVTKIRVKIIGKISKKTVQQIVVKAELLFADSYKDCSATRSFMTGKNKNAEADDNDYGDFIVADFNFDGKEDFAVKRDSGGNGGAFYEYYTQNKPGVFQKDAFLTDEIGYFPGTIDARNKQLVTYIHANVAGYNENIYKYNPTTKKWIFFKQTYRKVE